MHKLNSKNIFLAASLLCSLVFLFPSRLPAQTPMDDIRLNTLRSLDDIFPGLGDSRKKEIFGEAGLFRSYDKNGSLELLPASGSGIEIINTIMKSKPAYLAESLLVIPYSNKILDKLDAYNALGRIRDLKGRLYQSYTRKQSIPLFEDATRLDNAKRTNPIPDPTPAKELPQSETVYMRLKDTNFGNSYYRGDMSPGPFGITYCITNYKTITYLIFTVMKEEKFTAALYLEPLREGMLVYSVAGADASDFIASKIHIPSAIEKRLAVFIGWVSDNLKAVK